MIPVYVAPDRGFFGHLDVDLSTAGKSEVQALLIAGETDVGWPSPVETARFVSADRTSRLHRSALDAPPLVIGLCAWWIVTSHFLTQSR